MSDDNDLGPASCHSRRAVLVATGAGLCALAAGCGVYGATGVPAGAPPAPNEKPPTPAGTPAGGGGAPGGGAGTEPVLATTADIPVGGGMVLAEQGVVLTRPDEGTVLGFSSVCTHQGCTVADVSDGTINCSCHGSRFQISDGAVASGPASRSLPSVAVTVNDGAISLA